VRLQIAPSDIIECNVPPYEEQLKVDLVRRGFSS
jgi:pyrimidine operon attenuation protein/uracil phosphoribosyltransferase